MESFSIIDHLVKKRIPPYAFPEANYRHHFTPQLSSQVKFWMSFTGWSEPTYKDYYPSFDSRKSANSFSMDLSPPDARGAIYGVCGFRGDEAADGFSSCQIVQISHASRFVSFVQSFLASALLFLPPNGNRRDRTCSVMLCH
jgi:hypothetical protein